MTEVLPKYRYNAHVLKAVDGDTLDVLLDLGFSVSFKTRLRLIGLDCPESAGKGKCSAGLAAKKFTTDFCEGAQVEIEVTKQEKYGRYLATVYKDGMSLNAALLAGGFAKPYDGGKRV